MPKRLRTGATVTLLTLGVTVSVGVLRPDDAGAITRTRAVAVAAAYGRTHGYHVGIAVYDTWRHRSYGGGDDTGTFASESVVKVMIANRLIVQGRMHGNTARRAYRMIIRSDDAIASSFYSSVGGDGLINWIKRRYHVWNLGSPPSRFGWWGNTHITARGLVLYYARMKRDRRVAPWLLNAMHHTKRFGSDGTWQFFGIPQATHGAAIKQGWGCDYDDFCTTRADFNTTGFVNGNRYAVAILARGPLRDYGKAISGLLTRMARLLLPGGHFPAPLPAVSSLSMWSGRTAGGQRITVHGHRFTHVLAVRFGSQNGRAIDVLGPRRLRVTTPAHRPGRYQVRVVTTHGMSPAGSVRFRFIAPPVVSSLQPASGSTQGGTTVTVHGGWLGTTSRVMFGGHAGTDLHVISSTSLTVTSPAEAAGTVDVRVVTRYGTSRIVAADQYTYVAAPSVTAVSPAAGPTSGGTLVTITGRNLGRTTAVSFGSMPASKITIISPRKLTAVAPAHGGGQVELTVRTPGGASHATPADRYVYNG